MNSNIDIFFKNGNINNLKVKELEFGATNLKNEFTENLNIFKITNNDGSNLNISKNKSFMTTERLGINTVNPVKTLDVNGDIKFEDSLFGTNNKKIMNQTDNTINLNPDNQYTKLKTKGNFNISNGGLLIGDSDVDVNNGDLIIGTGIYDSDKSKIIEIDNNNINIGSSQKNLKIKGNIKFEDSGVNIGANDESPEVGELNVSKKISTNMIEINEDGDKKIVFNGTDDSNIYLGDNTISSMFKQDKNTILLGNNLEINDSNVKVINTEHGKYSGILLNGDDIEFHNKGGNNYKGEGTLDRPNLTLSNNGQLIYTIPIINLTNGKVEIDKDNDTNEVYEYVRSHLTDKQIGSSITFSVNTSKYFLSDKFFNFVKNRDNFARGYLINKVTNDTEEVYEVEFR